MEKDSYNAGYANELMRIAQKDTNDVRSDEDLDKLFRIAIVPTTDTSELLKDASDFFVACDNSAVEAQIRKHSPMYFIERFSYPDDYENYDRNAALQVLRDLCEKTLNEAKKRDKRKVFFTKLKIENKNIKGKNAKAIADNLMQECYRWIKYNKNYVEEKKLHIYFEVDKKLLPLYRDAKNDANGDLSKRRALAIVLQGGGARGAFQLGVWNILQKKGITSRITGFSGTSVGALNEFIFASEADEKDRENTWRVFTSNLLTDRDQKKLRQEICEVLKAHWEESDYKEYCSCHDMYLTVYNIRDRINPNKIDERYINWKRINYRDLADTLCASARHPIIYWIKKGLADGGTGNYSVERSLNKIFGNKKDFDDTNVPIQPLYDIGYRHFVVIYTDHPSDRMKAKEATRYSDATFYRFYPQKDKQNRVQKFMDMVNVDEGRIVSRIEAGEAEAKLFFDEL